MGCVTDGRSPDLSSARALISSESEGLSPRLTAMPGCSWHQTRRQLRQLQDHATSFVSNQTAFISPDFGRARARIKALQPPLLIYPTQRTAAEDRNSSSNATAGGNQFDVNKPTKGKEMPWIRVDLSSGRTPEQKQKTAAAITAVMVEHCNCAPESVSIVFNDVTDDNWAFGGTLTSEKKKAASSQPK
jgi:4-oxalocrotonate tautomerase